MNKHIVPLTVSAVFALSLCACGHPEMKPVTILDERYKTELEIPAGSTVGEAIALAEITLGKNDSVKPDLTEQAGKKIKIGRSSNIVFNYDGKKEKISLAGATVEDLLKKKGLDKTPHLVVNYDRDVYLSEIEDELIAYLEKAVTLTVDGSTETYFTAKKTVREFLSERKIKLGKLDRLSAKPTAGIKDGMSLRVRRVEQKEITVTEAIAFTVKSEYSSSMFKGESKVTKDGQAGEKKVTYLVTYVDGVEESRTVKSETVVKQPVTKIVTYGTKEKPKPSTTAGRKIVSRQDNPDCDGSGHGYWYIIYSDGTTDYVDY